MAVVACVVMAIGYAFVFNAIGTPPAGDLATLDVPSDGTAAVDLLDEGQPVFVTALDGSVTVIDARAPRAPNTASTLVAWCRSEAAFVDLATGRSFDAAGRPLDGDVPGLSVYRTRPSDEGARVVVEPTSMTASANGATERTVTCPVSELIGHAIDPAEIFDPSVAVDEEPPGWIWLEGTLVAADDEARLCDGLEDGCDAWAVASGIDPATVTETRGQFIGRVRDGAIAGLIIVPDLGGSP